MSRQDKIIDRLEYFIGGPLFLAVSTITAAVMAVGFLPITAYQRLSHH